MASVVLPPALPLPSEDAQNRRKQATRLRERRAEQAERRKLALAFAAEAGDEDAAEELGQLEEEPPPTRYRLGAEIGQVAAAEAGEGSSNEMHSAAYHGLIDQLIKVEKSAASLKMANSRDSLGRTPLHVAVKQGHTHCVEALLSLGSAIDAEDEGTGFTPLMLAAQAGQLAMCATLLRRGADLHATAMHDDIEDEPKKGKKKHKKKEQGRTGRVSATELAADPEVERLLRACNDAVLRDPQGGVVRVCSAVLSREIDPPPPPPGLPPIHEPGPGRQRRPTGGIDHLSPSRADPGPNDVGADQAVGTGLSGIMAASRFKRMMKQKKVESTDEDLPPTPGEVAGTLAAANALALPSTGAGATGSGTGGGGVLALMAKAGADRIETGKSKETTRKKKTASAVEAESASQSGPPVVLEDGSQVQRADLRAPPEPPSLETLKEVNMLRRLVREEKAASEATHLTQLTRVYEQRERNWQRQVEAANEESRLATKQAEKARAEAETTKAMFQASQKDLVDAKNRMRQAVATEQDAIERCAKAEREREIAEAAVARLEPVLEKLREDIANAAEQAAQDKSTQEAAVYWRKQEKQEHEQEVARLEKQLSESVRRQRDAEKNARELQDRQNERDRKDREEMERQAWKRAQEQKAKLIQRRFRKYKKAIALGGALYSSISAKKTKSASGVAEEERVLALRDSCRWIGPESDRDPYCASILVSRLPEDADEVELLHLFEDCGPIASIRVLREEPTEANSNQRHSRGHAIVSYYTTIAAELALQDVPDPPKPPQDDEGPPPPPPAGGKNGLILKGQRVSGHSLERVGDKPEVKLECTYADQKSVEKANAARIATPKSADDKKGKGKGKGKGKTKGKGKGKGKGKPGTASSSGAGSPRSPGSGDPTSYELMFSDERASWHAERAQWKRERKALLDYFETEREALSSQTEVVKLELQHVLDFLARIREMRYEDGVPPAEEEVNDYLTYLKINGAASRVHLRWLAEEAMHAPLPYGWTAHRHPDTLEPYYYHRPTQVSSYEHPIDELCRVTAQNLTNSLVQQRDAHGKVASIRAELEARHKAIDAVEKAIGAKKLYERAVQELEAMNLLTEQVAKKTKSAKGKQAKEEAKTMFNQAEEQAAEAKRRAEEAELAFLNASFAADDAQKEADMRTQNRQNRTPWKDHDTSSPRAETNGTRIASGTNAGVPAAASGETAIDTTGTSAEQLPSAVAPPKNTLIVTIVCAQSVHLSSDDSGVHGGRSSVFCVVRIESWHQAIDVTSVRRLPHDQTNPNEISWQQQEGDDAAVGSGGGDGTSGCKVSFESIRGSREGLPTTIAIELRRRPIDEDEDGANWDPRVALQSGDYGEDGSAVLGVATLRFADMLGLDAASLEREQAPRQIPAEWYELVPYMASGMGDQASHAEARARAAGEDLNARPRTSAGRVKVKLDWLPPGTSSVSDLNATAELHIDLNVGDNRLESNTVLHDGDGGASSRRQSVGRAGTPLMMGPTTTRFNVPSDGQGGGLKEDAVGTAQYTAAVE